MEVVVDANVWLSALSSSEPGHVHSVQFLREAMARRVMFALPLLIIPEVAGTAARRTHDPANGSALIEHLLRLPNARFFDLDSRRAKAAAELACKVFLRGADSQYAALAVERNSPLITLDRELHERAASHYDCLTPEEWLTRFG